MLFMRPQQAESRGRDRRTGTGSRKSTAWKRLRATGAAIIERLFTPSRSHHHCESHRNKFRRYAARFAAKEAAMKALGTGWRAGVRWRDIEVVREPSGKPTDAGDVARQRGRIKMGVKNISLTITRRESRPLNSSASKVIFENDV